MPSSPYSTITNRVTARVNPTATQYPPQRAKRDGVIAARSRTIPPYASACSNTAAYVSTCSCFGIAAASMTTLAPAMETELVTVTYGCADPGVCGGIKKHYPYPGTRFGNYQYCLCVLGTNAISFCTPIDESCASLHNCSVLPASNARPIRAVA